MLQTSNRHSLPRGSQPSRALAKELFPTPVSPMITNRGSGYETFFSAIDTDKVFSNIIHRKYMLRVEHVQLNVINSKYNTSEVTCDKIVKSRYMASFQEATHINPMTHAGVFILHEIFKRSSFVSFREVCIRIFMESK